MAAMGRRKIARMARSHMARSHRARSHGAGEQTPMVPGVRLLPVGAAHGRDGPPKNRAQ